MLIQEFFKKCDKETRNIIILFLSLCDNSKNRFQEIAPDVSIKTKDEKELSYEQKMLVFLVLVCLNYSQNLKKILEKFEVSEKEIYEKLIFSVEAKELINKYAVKQYYLKKLYLEQSWYRLWGSFIKAFCDNQKSDYLSFVNTKFILILYHD